jgi:MFS family permease
MNMTSRKRLYLLFFLVFLFQMGFGLVTPVLPLYADSFGLGEIAVGWVIAIYGVARVIADLPAIWLARRIGNAWAIAVGALMLAVGSLFSGLASSYEWLLVHRFISGAGAAITLVIGQSMVASNPGPYSRGKALSLYQGFFLAGVSCGPFAGGLMADHLGMRAPFFAYAALAVAVAALAAAQLHRAEKRELEEAPAGTGQSHEAGQARVSDSPRSAGCHPDASGHLQPSLGQSLMQIARDVPFLLISLLTLLQHFTRTGGVNGLIPLHGANALALSSAQIGYVMAASGAINLAAVFVTGGLSDRLGRKTLIVPASLMIAACLGVFACAPSFGWFMLGGVLWGLGAGISGPVAAAYVTDRVKGNDHGSAMALYRMLSDFGYIAGPLMLGAISEWYGIAAALIATAVLYLLCTLVFHVFSPETAGRRAPSHFRNPAVCKAAGSQAPGKPAGSATSK